jgi:GAG-pre-integrase domain
MWTEGGSDKYKRLHKMVKDTTLMYDTLVEHRSSIPAINDDLTKDVEEVYEPSKEWDDISAVRHEGDGVLTISGQDHAELDGTSSTALLEWHMRFGHMPFPRLQLLAKEGILPKRLATCQIPICASCMYGKLSRKPWRYRQLTLLW